MFSKPVSRTGVTSELSPSVGNVTETSDSAPSVVQTIFATWFYKRDDTARSVRSFVERLIFQIIRNKPVTAPGVGTPE